MRDAEAKTKMQVNRIMNVCIMPSKDGNYRNDARDIEGRHFQWEKHSKEAPSNEAVT